MPLQATSGAASYDAFGGGVAAVPQYIEDVFSTYLYTGNGSTQTITNGIDLAGKGGLVWTKQRNGGAVAQDNGHALIDTVRGRGSLIQSNTTAAALAPPAGYQISSFGSSGYTLGADYYVLMNDNASTFASWTFRKQPKFFDVVTWTGDGTARNISHNLGSVPGCVIIKRTDTTSNWMVSHRGSVDTWAILNGTNAFTSSAGAGTIGADGYCYLSGSTDTYFRVVAGATGYAAVNASGGTYVAYLFAHNAGGFGLTGTDNVISCGSFTTNGSGLASVTLGYEPQWMMLKASTAAEPWNVTDTMRGWTQSGTNDIRYLQPNTSGAEGSASNNWEPNATGFSVIGGLSSSTTYIYIAIRRGPMKVPTSGTSVYMPVTANNAQGTQNTTGFPVDLQVQAWRGGVNSRTVVDRLRGVSTTATNTEKYLTTNTSDVETSGTSLTQYWNNTGFQTPSGFAGFSEIYWNFRRAPNFFDEVCYTGTGTNGQTYSHNLGVAPQLMLFKERAVNAQNWWAYVASLGADNNLILNSTSAAFTGSNLVNGTNPTASVFTTGPNTYNNQSGQTYVAYLFTTLAGVSKVGSYTGTGALQTINCGFTSGARFIMIKRTDSTGGWYVWDSARGISSGNDPYILWNSTASEETTFNYVDTDSTGFKVTAAAPANLNASGGNYIFLAIA